MVLYVPRVSDQSGITPSMLNSSKIKRNPDPSPIGTRFGFLLFGTINAIKEFVKTVDDSAIDISVDSDSYL